MKRGEIFIAKLDPTVGAEIKKTRPVAIVSNDANNEMAKTVTIVPLSSQNTEKIRFFEVLIPDDVGLTKRSKARADQIRTIDKSRLTKKVGRLDADTMIKLNRAVKVHLDL
jgi:mRNA interferase MazF